VELFAELKPATQGNIQLNCVETAKAIPAESALTASAGRGKGCPIEAASTRDGGIIYI
jgi:hypothetical protein